MNPFSGSQYVAFIIVSVHYYAIDSPLGSVQLIVGLFLALVKDLVLSGSKVTLT